jgi:hypothetical protein
MMATDDLLAITRGSVAHQEPPRDPLAPFLSAVKAAFGFSSFSWDLCGGGFRRADRCFELVDNPLVQNWSSLGCHWGHVQSNLWLRPPPHLRGKIEPWVQKCAESTRCGLPGVRIFLLTSPNVASKWFDRWVADNARVYLLRTPLGYLGNGPWNTQMLSVFDGTSRGIELWNWHSPHGVLQGGVSKQVVTPVSSIVPVQ